MNCIRFRLMAVILLLLADNAQLRPDSGAVFIPFDSEPRPWIAGYSPNSDDGGEDFSASGREMRDGGRPPRIRSIPGGFARRRDADRDGLAEGRVDADDHFKRGTAGEEGIGDRMIPNRIGKKALGVFAHTRPFFKLSSSQANSEMLNAFVRGNFGMSKLTFDRPRPLRWG